MNITNSTVYDIVEHRAVRADEKKMKSALIMMNKKMRCSEEQ